MTDIEALARQAGIRTDLIAMGAASLVYSEGCAGVALAEFARFAALVRAATLEEANEACRQRWLMVGDFPGHGEDAIACMRAIRALMEQETEAQSPPTKGQT